MNLVDARQLFWLLWAATTGVCLWQVGRAVSRPRRALELPLVASLVWLYFYSFMAWHAARELDYALNPASLCLGQFVALISVLGLFAGWRFGARAASVPADTPARYHRHRIWLLGLALLAAGAAAQHTFVAGEKLDYANTSGYWQTLFVVGYPGLALCLSAICMTPALKRPVNYALLALATVALMYPFLIAARRGPLFPLMIVLLYVPPLVSGTRPNAFKLIAALVAAGGLMLLFIAIRPWLYTIRNPYSVRSSGQAVGAWRTGLSELSAADVVTARNLQLGDNEYAYHCGAVLTIYETGRYQYGTGYLTLLAHWIPHRWWPDKPALQQGLFPSAIQAMPAVMGWSMTPGASIAGAANVFEQFGFLCPLFWFLIGRYAARLYVRAARGRDLIYQFWYVAILCASHWLISQGFGAAFVPWCFFAFVPWLVLRFAKVPEARRAASPHAARAAASY